jgi:hypothetical protein
MVKAPEYGKSFPSYIFRVLHMYKSVGSDISLGGDTIWTSQTALFDKLSPTFQKTFEGLHAVHSSEVSANNVITYDSYIFNEFAKSSIAYFHQHY